MVIAHLDGVNYQGCNIIISMDLWSCGYMWLGEINQEISRLVIGSLESKQALSLVIKDDPTCGQIFEPHMPHLIH